MKLLDRYLIRHFMAPFGVAVAMFCVLVSLGRFFDKMSVFVRFEAGWKDIVSYILLGLPFWLNLVLPVATMLAVLFSLGHLQQRGEFTAFRGAGVPSWRLYLPFLMMGLFLSIISLVCGLSFLPKLNFESRKIYRADIKKRDVLDYRKDNLVTAGRDQRRFTIGWLDVNAGLMKEVIVDRFDDNFTWQETITAKEAEHRGGQWLFRNGVWRTPDPESSLGVHEEPFTDKLVPIPERPSDFAVEDKAMDDMTGNELRRRANRLKIRGAPVHEERVAYHMRWALPFANVVVVLLAIPFALRSGVQARTQNFAYAMVLAFLYWGVASFFRSVGEQGRVLPWIAAWMSNFLFLGFAGWKLFRFNG